MFLGICFKICKLEKAYLQATKAWLAGANAEAEERRASRDKVIFIVRFD